MVRRSPLVRISAALGGTLWLYPVPALIGHLVALRSHPDARGRFDAPQDGATELAWHVEDTYAWAAVASYALVVLVIAFVYVRRELDVRTALLGVASIPAWLAGYHALYLALGAALLA